MADINLKTETPDTSLPTTGFLFGADSQAAASPSVYSTQTVATTLLGSTTLSGETITADAPVLNMSQTWNNAAVTFTGLKLNVTDTASNASSLLLDLQVGGASRFTVNKLGLFQAASSFALNTGYNTVIWNLAQFGWASSATVTTSTSLDTILTRRAAANLRLGAADAAAPVAQTLSVQSVVAGTTNIAGQPFVITGSQGTGNAAGGSIIFQVAPAGGSGALQNGLATALTIASTTDVTFAANAVITGKFFINADLTGNDYFFGSNFYARTTVRLASGTPLGWSSSATAPNAAADLILTRDAANTLAQRNANNGQIFRLYGRFTDITNDFERFFINAPTTSGAAVLLGTQKGATTGTARALEFQTDGTTRLTIAAAGSATFSGFTVFSGGTIRLANSDGDITLSSGTVYIPDTTRFAIGGSTSSFPALKRVSANLQVIAADGTSSAGLIVGNQALATTATDGFLYVPTCAGTPTGTPTAQTGTAPIVINTTNNKLYFYSDGQWRDAGP